MHWAPGRRRLIAAGLGYPAAAIAGALLAAGGLVLILVGRPKPAPEAGLVAEAA